MRETDVIYVDMPSDEAAKNSSSYNLSIFSSGTNSEGAMVTVATREDSSPSVGELWPDIDELDNPLCKDTSVAHARNALIHREVSTTPVENTNEHSRVEGNRDSLTDVAGTSDFRSTRHEGRSTRREATQILSAAPGAISP
jgi:hypothetical protein